ncbi:PREDICTED: putative pentatricopeptide repeat-containing protein At1g13800 isoform X1 [Camelina sativa]|uniref:Pentatricopeptide repeat-containing protein At1g13800 isoform X1 n=1 Tax=Camelina sativa TaxID=90675 RepID=A0ABM0VNH6_CAMSA|nr:PREDICTED: putative pentatricopeptide repeat-containing protein At1g13800 isoform X1 [Camelina sativa]XP_019090781.1 PREDICTED: putative pentatricopeptide repeat-containing protein At1g13800 isoform X1 [Camelina sativa]
MRVFPIPILSHVRGLIRRAPSSRFYVVSALARKENPSISQSEQVKEGNFDCNVLELNEIGVLRVLNTMKDDPFLALSFLKRIEGNGALPSLQAYAAVIRIVCGCGLDQKLNPFFMGFIRKGDEGRGFTVMELFNAIGEAEVSLVLLTRVSTALVKAYANLQLFDEAVEFFFRSYYSLGRAPDIKALNFLLSRMIASGRTDLVVGVFWEIERLGLDADAHTYVLVVKALCRNDDTEGVEKLLSRLLNSETRNPCVFYMNFIEGLCLNQMAGIAYLLLQPLRDANFLVGKSVLGIAYRQVVRGLCNEMNIEVAESAVVDMEELGVDPDVYVYSALIEVHRKSMNVPKALDIFNKMVEKRVRINCVIVSSILQCCCQMGKFSDVCDLFKEVREMNIPLDRVCYNVAFDALGKLGKVDEAIELFREMKVEGIAPDVINYTTLIRGCCLQGKCSEAFDLMIEMDGTGKTPDIIIYNVLAGGLARNGLAVEALETLKLMEARGVKPTYVTHNRVIEGLIVAGKLDEAEAFYESLEHKSRENDASMVKGYCEAGCLDQAYERFIRLEFPLPKSVYFTLFTSLCAEKDYISKAQDLLDRMWELGVEPEKSMYGRLIGAWCRVNNVRKAQKFFEILLSKEIIPDLFTYTIMINTCCRLNKLKQAYALFQDMKRRDVKPDVVTYTVLLNSIPELDMKREMEAFDVKRDVVYYTVMINRYCQLNDLEKAKTHFKEMKKREIVPDVVTYTVLLSNDPELDLTREMKAFDVKPDVFYYTVLIDRQCKMGDLTEAKRIFDQMIKSGVDPDAAPYTALIVGCCKMGNLKEAKMIFDLMIESGLKPDAVSYTTLIAGFRRNGSARKAVTLMKEMLANGIKPTEASLSVLKAKRLR